jgi:predicted nucleotidyltransferase
MPRIFEMELSSPFRIITPTVDGDVLYVLARADASFTPPQVHRLIGARSEDGVRRSLVRLADQGIVSADRVGNAVEYRLNREHLAADAIATIARLRDVLVTRLREIIQSWIVPTPFAAIFGSAARGTMSPSSDIDVLIIRTDGVDAMDAAWTDQVHELALLVHRWTGNDTQILEYDESALRRRTVDPVIDDVVRDGIPVVGTTSYLRRVARSR